MGLSDINFSVEEFERILRDAFRAGEDHKLDDVALYHDGWAECNAPSFSEWFEKLKAKMGVV